VVVKLGYHGPDIGRVNAREDLTHSLKP
jgi:hypothetical protein